MASLLGPADRDSGLLSFGDSGIDDDDMSEARAPSVAGVRWTQRRKRQAKAAGLCVAAVTGFIVFVVLCVQASRPRAGGGGGSGGGGNGPAPQPAPPPGPVRFLVLGDWGRRGADNQSAVAAAMAATAATQQPLFVLSTGDNFYDAGLRDDEDPLFDDTFTRVYTQPELAQLPFYNVLGNHDRYGNASAQLSPRLTQRDARWNAARSGVLEFGAAPGSDDDALLALFLLDTTPFIKEYRPPFAGTPSKAADFSDLQPPVWPPGTDRTVGVPSGPAWDAWEAATLAELDQALAESSALWKVVVGHHAIRSYSTAHGSQPELAPVDALLRRHHVPLYLNGHDHVLQCIRSSPPPRAGPARPGGRWRPTYVTSGGGSRTRDDVVDPRDGSLRFAFGYSGYVAVDVAPERVRLQFLAPAAAGAPPHLLYETELPYHA